MEEPQNGLDSTPPGVDGGARLPALTPAGRELLEVLWSAGCPLTTRQAQDAIGRAFPHRAGRKIQAVSTLVDELPAPSAFTGRGLRIAARISSARTASIVLRLLIAIRARPPIDAGHAIDAVRRYAQAAEGPSPRGC